MFINATRLALRSRAHIANVRLFSKTPAAKTPAATTPAATNDVLAFTKFRNQTFKKSWLMDISTYPTVAILVFAVSFCGSVGFTCLGFNPDVQIVPSKRQSVIRNWGL